MRGRIPFLATTTALVKAKNNLEDKFIHIIGDRRRNEVAERVKHDLGSDDDVPLGCEIRVLAIKVSTEYRKLLLQIGADKHHNDACIEVENQKNVLLDLQRLDGVGVVANSRDASCYDLLHHDVKNDNSD